jgi:hypothetical protein
MSLTEIIQYERDVGYALCNFETGFSRRDVVSGYFSQSESGQNQRLLYDGLLDNGFKRTHWQIVFPGQTAGLVRKIEPIDSMDEMHVRFYDDGCISSELERRRFSFGHWRIPRKDGNDKLAQIINDEISGIPPEQKKAILSQVKSRHYSAVDPNEFGFPPKILKASNVLGNVAFCTFLSIQYPLVTAVAVSGLCQGDFYALEPAAASIAEAPFFIGMIRMMYEGIRKQMQPNKG